MTITLNLAPEVEAGLVAQAQTLGLSLEAYLTQVAQEQSRSTSSKPLAGEEWERELDALNVGLPDAPTLSDEAMKRENWYSDGC